MTMSKSAEGWRRRRIAVSLVLDAAAASVADGRYPTLEIALCEMAANHRHAAPRPAEPRRE